MTMQTELKPLRKNYLNIGDRVRMKDGRLLTVAYLEYYNFAAKEEKQYQSKADIIEIL